MMAPLIDASLDRTRTVLTTLVVLLVMGVYAYVNIPKESSPDIDIPQIYVSAHLEGISPDDAERLLVRPLEQELSSIEGVKEMKATAHQNGGFVLLEFQAGFDKDKALDDVQKAVDVVRPDLPMDVDEPTVNEVNFSLFPVLVVTLSGEVPERALLGLARELQDEFETLPQVLEAAIAGNREEVVEILIDPVELESYNLDGNSLLTYFDRSNRLVAAGNLDSGTGRFAVKVPGLFEDLEDILSIPLLVSGDSVIEVRDIAEIRRTFKDPESFARLNGEKAIALEIVKRSGENVIDTIAAVRELVDKNQKYWPENIVVTYTQDQSKKIRDMLKDLQNNIISAILLVMIVIVAALGLRAASLVGIAIPGAFLTGILFLYAIGLTVNIVVLFALILSVGMLVDGAIVVIEYADRKMAEGLPKKEAYAQAAKRMAWPITASTATTLAAFSPLLYWPDVVGEFMKYMPITLIAVLSSSLVMALIFIPALGGLIGKPGTANNPKAMEQIALAENGDLSKITGLTGAYLGVLRGALKHPFLVLGSAVLLLVGVIFLYGKIGNGKEFFPSVEPEVANVLIHARGNLSVYEQDQLVKEVEDRILDVKGIEAFYVRTGEPAQRGSDLSEDVIGQIQMQFDDWQGRKPALEILQDIRDRTADLPGILVETRQEEAGPPTGKAIQIELASRFPELLPDAVETIRGAMEELGGYIDVEDSRALPGIEWELEVDRAQASKFGLDLTGIGQYVRMVTNGLKVAEYRPDDSDEEIDIVVRHDKQDRTIDQLDRIRIESGAGSVPITNFVKRVAQPAVGNINRASQKRILTIQAEVLPGTNVNSKVVEIRKWLAENAEKINKDVEVSFKGEDEDQREAQQFLAMAFLVALAMMAIILLTQFNSFYSVILILSAVIMSTIGVFIGLMLTGQPFGVVMSGIGIIALAGIIVNNNIVLIDTYDQMKNDYGDQMDRVELVLRTGAQRLRPVLLTTITTVLGLLPMVLQVNIDFVARDLSIGAPSTQWWVQLSTAIAFGLSFSTVLTLIVTPSALVMPYYLNEHIRTLRDKFGRRKFEEVSDLEQATEQNTEQDADGKYLGRDI